MLCSALRATSSISMYCTFTTLFIRTHRTFPKSTPCVLVSLILGPYIRLYIFIAAACSMEALGYPPLSNLGTAVLSLPCLKDSGLINPDESSTSPSLSPLSSCVVCCGLGSSRPEQPFVTLLAFGTPCRLLQPITNWFSMLYIFGISDWLHCLESEAAGCLVDLE